MMIVNRLVFLSLFLTVLSCKPRQLVHRLDPVVIKSDLYDQKVYIKDTALTKYLGLWTSDHLEINFTKIKKQKWAKKSRAIGELVHGKITFKSDSQSTILTYTIPVVGGSMENDVLAILGVDHDFNAKLTQDSIYNNVLHWKNNFMGQHFRFIGEDGKTLDGKIVLRDLKIPDKLLLQKVK